VLGGALHEDRGRHGDVLLLLIAACNVLEQLAEGIVSLLVLGGVAARFNPDHLLVVTNFKLCIFLDHSVGRSLIRPSRRLQVSSADQYQPTASVADSS